MSSLPDMAHKPLESNYIIHIPKILFFFKDDDSNKKIRCGPLTLQSGEFQCLNLANMFQGQEMAESGEFQVPKRLQSGQ